MPSTSKVREATIANEDLPNHSLPEEQVQNDVEDVMFDSNTSVQVSQAEFESIQVQQESLIQEFDAYLYEQNYLNK